MADRFLTLLDMTKRNGTDAAVGLVEEVNTVAPEIDSLLGRPISGISYKIKKRRTLPTGPAFRNANEGSDIISSAYEQTLAECFYLDGQLRVDEAVVTAGQAEGNSLNDVLADEAVGVMRQKMIALGDQFYRGTTANAKGFQGLQAFYDTSACEVSAGGSSGAACSAWLVWNDLQGVHWIFGNNTGLNMGAWQRQQVTDSNSKAYMAYVNNLAGWIGLSCAHTRSVVRIKLITSAKPLTDALVAEALSKMPIFMRNQRSSLKLFCNSSAALWLQQSRSVVISSGVPQRSNASGDHSIWAPVPTESNGVPIVLTDSLPQTE